MNIFIYFLFTTTLIFPETIPDSISIDNKIIIPEIKIYGGLDENSISTDIDVIKNDEFNINGKNNFQDLLQSNGSLHYAGGTSRPKYFQLRGLGELSQFSGEGAPHFYVGYIIDNIDFSGIGMIGNLYDIKQIEIFKGPQSSVYGPNSMAGVINLVSNMPKTKKSFNYNTSIYSNNGQSVNISASLPLTKKLLSKISISSDYNNGFIKNKSDSGNIRYNSNSTDEVLLKYQLSYLPNDKLSLNLTSYFIDLDNKYDVWTPDNNGFITYSDFQGIDKQKTYAASINLQYRIQNMTFTSITTYSKNNINYAYDGDWGNLEYWEQEPFNWYEENENLFSEEICYDYYYYYPCYYEYDFQDITDRKRTSISQEIRLKKNLKKNLTFIAGLYLSDLEEIDKRDGWLFAGAATNIYSKFDILNYAIYVQLAYPLSNKLILSSTLRYDINKTKNYLIWLDYYSYPNSSKYEVKDNNLIGGTIRLNYKYNDNLFFNSSISRGYKTSGINQTPLLEESLKLYNTEYCNNLNLGIHYEKEDYKFIFSAFYIHRDNPQLRLSYQHSSDPTSFDYATFNTRYGYNYGFELNVNLKVSDNIAFNPYLSYLRTYVSSFQYIGENIYGNRDTAHSPKYKYGFSIKYDMSKTIEGLSLNMNSNFVGSFYFEEQNDIKSTPYNLVDLSINYNIDNIEISLWTKNITDKKYEIRGYTFALDPTFISKSYQSFGNPKTVGITLDFNI